MNRLKRFQYSFVDINSFRLVQFTAMDKKWEKQIISWTKLRDQADGMIKSTLENYFPCPYGYSKAKTSEELQKFTEKSMGRSLFAYARSDLLIKTLELEREQQKKNP